ncbi:flagellar biosynthetic protein FliR [Sulfitobacter sp. F26169L]|uniref:flagellar biosynthetic protein FliR n=1 Tax=Sulfitobacter sp. F26169L TaxID=2996015 RepID=UPI002260896E|nr:flagellar biosynthetic protein FliR [Sulfitobacter sp. F26169L]MCX7565778.1 flagellar biosynthetic protein FliR [Sulfitobacter sp. F26169L]
MIQSLAEMMEVTDAMLWHGFAVFLRVSALVSLLPAFGEQSVPARVKLGIALAFTLIITPAVAAPDTAMKFDSIIWMSLTEIAAGLLLGIGIRLFVLALQTAGSIAAQSTSLAQILGGAVAEPVPAMGHILVTGGLALAVMTGLHVRAAEMVILSYEMLPMGRLPSGSDVSQWGVDQIRRAFSLAFTLAAPFVILSVLYNVALGVINKAMPQLMVAFVGAPVITAGGLILLCLSAPLLLSTWVNALNSFVANPLAPVP